MFLTSATSKWQRKFTRGSGFPTETGCKRQEYSAFLEICAKIITLLEANSILACKFMDVLDGRCRIVNLQLTLGWSDSIAWSRKCCRHHKVFKARRRKYKQ